MVARAEGVPQVAPLLTVLSDHSGVEMRPG
jgi:hypothetical protein